MSKKYKYLIIIILSGIVFVVCVSLLYFIKKIKEQPTLSPFSISSPTPTTVPSLRLAFINIAITTLPNYLDRDYNNRLIVDLLVTDPQGRKTGYNPITKKNYNEIPHSLYYPEKIINPVTSESFPPYKTIYIGQPEDGPYRLQVIGYEPGTFDLSIGAFDLNGSSTIETLKTGLTRDNSVSEYFINYTSQPGQPTTIEEVVVIK